MSSAEGGCARSEFPDAFRRTREVSGRMRNGQIYVLSVELNCNSKELALIFGYWNVAMGLRAEFTIVSLKMIDL